MEEINIRDSIETFEKELNDSQVNISAGPLQVDSFNKEPRRSVEINENPLQEE